MKILAHSRRGSAGSRCLLPSCWRGQRSPFAQVPSAGSPTGINAAFVKLFGTVGAFTAKVETQVLDQSQKETVRMPMDFAALDGKVRLEINLAQMQSKDLPRQHHCQSEAGGHGPRHQCLPARQEGHVCHLSRDPELPEHAPGQRGGRGRREGSQAGEEPRSARKPSMAMLA